MAKTRSCYKKKSKARPQTQPEKPRLLPCPGHMYDSAESDDEVDDGISGGTVDSLEISVREIEDQLQAIENDKYDRLYKEIFSLDDPLSDAEELHTKEEKPLTMEERCFGKANLDEDRLTPLPCVVFPIRSFRLFNVFCRSYFEDDNDTTTKVENIEKTGPYDGTKKR